MTNFQVQHKDGAAVLRVLQRVIHTYGTTGSIAPLHPVHHSFPHRPGERREPAHSKRPGGQVGGVRGEEPVGGHHILGYLTRNRPVHPLYWLDNRAVQLADGLLHPRRGALHLDAPVRRHVRRLPRGPEVDHRGGEGKIGHFTRAQEP